MENGSRKVFMRTLRKASCPVLLTSLSTAQYVSIDAFGRQSIDHRDACARFAAPDWPFLGHHHHHHTRRASPTPSVDHPVLGALETRADGHKSCEGLGFVGCGCSGMIRRPLIFFKRQDGWQANLANQRLVKPASMLSAKDELIGCRSSNLLVAPGPNLVLPFPPTS